MLALTLLDEAATVGLESLVLPRPPLSVRETAPLRPNTRTLPLGLVSRRLRDTRPPTTLPLSWTASLGQTRPLPVTEARVRPRPAADTEALAKIPTPVP